MDDPFRRPRRSNILKRFQRGLGALGALFAPEKDRKEQLFEFAGILSDTEAGAFTSFINIQMANIFLAEYGVQLIANDRTVHVYEEWPGLDRRRRSGSIYREGIWAPGASTVLYLPAALRAEKGTVSQRCAFTFHRAPEGIGGAWMDNGPAGAVLRHLKGQALDHGAPAPLYRQRLTPDGYRKAHFVRYGMLGGATAAELKLATEMRGKVNNAIMALREADPAFLKRCEVEERKASELAEFLLTVTPRINRPEDGCRRIADQFIVGADDKQPIHLPPTKRVIRDENGVYWRGLVHPLLGPVGSWTRIGKFGAASEGRRLDRSTPIATPSWCHGLFGTFYRIPDPESAGFAIVAGKAVGSAWDLRRGRGRPRMQAGAYLTSRRLKPLNPARTGWGNIAFDLPKWAVDNSKTRNPMPYGDPWRDGEVSCPEPLRPVRFRDLWPDLVNCGQIVT
jgi:hypothetical protein